MYLWSMIKSYYFINANKTPPSLFNGVVQSRSISDMNVSEKDRKSGLVVDIFSVSRSRRARSQQDNSTYPKSLSSSINMDGTICPGYPRRSVNLFSGTRWGGQTANVSSRQGPIDCSVRKRAFRSSKSPPRWWTADLIWWWVLMEFRAGDGRDVVNNAGSSLG